jgi:hypothetical protein
MDNHQPLKVPVAGMMGSSRKTKGCMPSPKPTDAPLIDRDAYRFQLALTDAIADYVRELRRAQLRALSYRGADFGRAIAVNLYFRLVNDPHLRSAYTRAAAGENVSEDPDAIPVSTVAYWALRQMLGRHARPTPRRLKEYVTQSLTIGRAHLPAEAPLAHRRGTVLILALSRRFFVYLLPVRRMLGPDAAWLVPAGAAWADEAAARGERIVPFGEKEGAHPEAPLTAPLAAYWRELALRFDTFRHILEQEAPAAVMVAEGNQPDDEILARAGQTLGVRSVCIQQGWSPIIHAGFRNMRYDDFCVWGPEFARLLQPENPHQRFAVTGSHRVEPHLPTQSHDKRAIAFFLQNSSLLITERAWREMLDFLRWTAAHWPEREILVREHPATPLTAQEQSTLATQPNIVFCPAAAVPLDAVLQRTGIAVAFYSTTLIEALAYDAAPLIINITGAPHYVPDLAAMGAGAEVKGFEAARTALIRLCEGEPAVRSRIPAILPRFFACSSAEALRNIAAVATSE